VGSLKDIVFDCADSWTLAHWWADVLGYRVRPHSDDDLAQLRAEGIERPEDDPNIAVDPIDGDGPGFWFCRVPEPKTVKNRVHVDVYGDVDELVGRGATLIEQFPRWTVLADPEGNEFCVFDRE
jgi:hypothetical protein